MLQTYECGKGKANTLKVFACMFPVPLPIIMHLRDPNVLLNFKRKQNKNFKCKF